MTPLMLSILLRSYWSPSTYVASQGGINALSIADKDALNQLAAKSLIMLEHEFEDSITAKGQTHIEALLAAPLPTQQWISGVPNASQS